jgi:hypothetical protein
MERLERVATAPDAGGRRMTATDPAPIACPNCASTQTTIMGSGAAICTDCATTWDPADAPAPSVLAAAIAADHEFEAEVEALTEQVNADAGLLLADLVGNMATLEGGQTGEVVAFDPNDDVIVRLDSGDLVHVPLADVIAMREPVAIPEPIALPDDPAELPADVRLSIELAQTIIRAGCESVNGTGEHVTPGVPPIGYLPGAPELHQVIERAAGLAVGMLIEMFELDVDVILEWVGATSEEATQGDPTTEETDNGE